MNLEHSLDAMRKAPGVIRLHGHRGARGILPENTLLGFRNTFDIGVKAVELDVLVTADGVPVVTHNPYLMAASTRGADREWLPKDSGLIALMTYEELQTFDVGGLRAGTDYANKFPDQAFLNDVRVPSLEQVVTIVTEPEMRDVWLNIEIKSSPNSPENTPVIPVLVAKVLKVLDSHEISGRVLLQSFDWRVLGEIKRQAPHIPLSCLTYEICEGATMEYNVYEGSPWMNDISLALHDGSVPACVSAMGANVWSPYYKDLTAEKISKAHDLGLIVNVWTVNELSDMERMIELGVDGIITDYPARAQRCFLAHGLSW